MFTGTLIYALLLIILFTILVVLFKIILPQKRIYDSFRAQAIPAAPYIPIIGQLAEIRRYRKSESIFGFQEDYVKKYGNIFVFCLGPTVRLFICEPNLLADMFTRTNVKNYIKPPIFDAVFTPIIGKKNLLVAQGEEHERARRMINPAFYHDNLKSMISIIADQTANAIDGIFAMFASNPDKQNQIDIQIHMNNLTLSIIASSAFGSGYTTITNAKDIVRETFGEVLDAIVHRTLILVNQIPIVSNLPIFKKAVVDRGAQMIGELVDQIIADRRKGLSTSLSNGPDLLDLLLLAVDEQNKPFTDQEVKEHTLTFAIAGSETTGNLMTWIFYMLTTHDHILKACQEEVDKVLPNKTKITHDHLSQLVVCEAVIHETLRLYPPAPLFTRYCIREHTIGAESPIRVPVGATIMVSTHMLHRRDDVWSHPNEFDYTRWLRDPSTGLKPKLPHPYAYLPFAAGNRNCIGQNFALLEAKIILAMFIQRCNFDLVPGQKIIPDFKITTKAKYGLWMKINERHISDSVET